MKTEMIATIVLTVLGSNALWGFIQFLISRSDAEKSKDAEILKAIETLSRKIDDVAEKSDERAAVNSRVRILRFADEMDRPKSKDSWDQVMSDITDYERYCCDHPGFRNGQTAATVSVLKEAYEEHVKNHNFGGGRHETE